MKPPAHRVPGRFAPDTCAVSLARLWRVYYTYEISFSTQKLHKTLQTQRRPERTITGRDTTYFGSTVGRCAVARARAPSRRACSGLHGSVAPPYRSPHPDPRRNRSSSEVLKGGY